MSLTKLVSPNSQPSSSTKSSLAPSSFSHHPNSTTISDNSSAHPCAVQPSKDRSFTPEDDPFRKDEVTPALLAFSRFPDSSPNPAYIQPRSESPKHLMGSRSLPVLPGGWSSDLDSPSPSAHALTESGGSHSPSGPSQSTSRTPILPSQEPTSPLFLSFPLPPSPQDSVSVPVLTVQVTTPAPCPPSLYPPPMSPPLDLLLCPPPVGVDNVPPPEPLDGSQKEISSKRRPGRDSSKAVQKSTPAGQGRRWHSHSHSPANRSPSSFTDQYMIASSRARDRDFQRTMGKRAFRKKDRPLTPFPTPLLAGQVRHDPTGRLQALKAAPRFTSSQTDPAIDQTAEAMPDSEVEPDTDFNVSYGPVHSFCQTQSSSLVHSVQSSKARKKISVSSAKSAQSTISSNSTTSESTTTSTTSIATTSTTATTVSPSTSTHTSVDKIRSGPPVLIIDEDRTTVSVEMYSTPSVAGFPSPEIFCTYIPQAGRDDRA
jgi:hypothetical protein